MHGVTVSRHQPVCKMLGVLSRFLFCFVFYSDVLYNLENETELLASMDIDHPVRNGTAQITRSGDWK